jgi:Fe-S oxidoreductase
MLNLRKLLLTVPHCFNTIKNEYPEFGTISDAPFTVEHHSVFINQIIKDNLISVNSSSLSSITFHDPCYLGRYNNEYDAPREVLESLGIINLKEMSSNKERSMCCGAGGGHYWHDMKVGERVNRLRVVQAIDTGAKTIGTACPFCMQMLEDGVKLEDQEGKLEVKDIAELVAEALIAPNINH